MGDQMDLSFDGVRKDMAQNFNDLAEIIMHDKCDTCGCEAMKVSHQRALERLRHDIFILLYMYDSSNHNDCNEIHIDLVEIKEATK